MNQQGCYGTLTLSRRRRLFQTRISILLYFQSPPVTRVTSLLTKHSQNTLVRLTLILTFLSLNFSYKLKLTEPKLKQIALSPAQSN